MSRTPLAQLRECEYWTPNEAALVLRRGRDFWIGLFDEGKIRGYLGGKANTRYIEAASARAFLAQLSAERCPDVEMSIDDEIREGKRRMREANKISYGFHS